MTAGGPAGEAHHNASGALVYGGVNQLLHHQCGAVIHVDGVGEIEDQHFMITYIHTDGVDQLGGRCDGKTPPQSHQTDTRREIIWFFRVILDC